MPLVVVIATSGNLRGGNTIVVILMILLLVEIVGVVESGCLMKYSQKIGDGDYVKNV